MAVQEHRRDAYVSGGLLRRFAQARPALLIAAFIFAALVQFVGLAVTPALIRYLNRLSDHLFVLARALNDNGAGDILWVPGGNLGQ